MNSYVFNLHMAQQDKMEEKCCEWCEESNHEDYMRYGIINSSEELGWICNQCDEENDKAYNDYYSIKGSLEKDQREDR